MDNFSEYIKKELESKGADLVGFGDLTILPAHMRSSMPVGIAIAVKYPKNVIRGIAENPTYEYYSEYNKLNKLLDALVTYGAETLQSFGYHAYAKTTSIVEQSETDYSTILPHKTVATRAGLGWIGKSALLVTEKFGSMVRISTILTNAPLEVSEPMSESRCGNCMICTDSCPAKAISGKEWKIEMQRSDFYNAEVCRKTAREKALKNFGIEITQCGKCINVCPYTQRYLNSEPSNFNFIYGENLLGENKSFEISRTAVRGIIFQNDKLLMIHTNKGDYKFAGGGIEKNETEKQALIREIGEETGFKVSSIGDIVGTAFQHKHDSFEPSKIYTMKSIYYSCTISENELCERNLDDYESDMEFQPVFISVKQALENNQNLLKTQSSDIEPWVKRDTDVLYWIYENMK